MGTICILLGIILFIGSIFLGCSFAAFMEQYLTMIGQSFTALLPTFTTVQLYMVCVGICGLIGLLIGLNLVMNGLIYNKVKRIRKPKKQ